MTASVRLFSNGTARASVAGPGTEPSATFIQRESNMNEQRTVDAVESKQQPSSQPPRILARRMARELTAEELEQISGGMRSNGGYTATSMCCDCDACDA